MSATRRFLSVEDVLLIHEDTIRHERGLPGVRDHGLLESAVMMAREHFVGAYLHRTIAEQAAAYLLHVCCNHPFVDGNKRSAVLAALVFLRPNGVVSLPGPDRLEELIMRCAAGELGKDEVTAFFRKHVRAPMPRPRANRRR